MSQLNYSPPPPEAPNSVPVPVYSSNDQHTPETKDSSSVPQEIKGWSWGGFLLSWIWAIGNHVWIGLLALIPIPLVGLIMQIVLGINGREWAWKKKHWESIEQFKSTQRKWAIWGFIISVIGVLMFLLFSSAVILMTINPKKQMERARCVNNCQNASDVQDCVLKCQKDFPSLEILPTGVLDNKAVDNSPSPSISPSIPTPKPTNIPTNQPTTVPTLVPSMQPTFSKFQSNGTQTLENGVTAEVKSANLSATVLSISITFKNTSKSTQTANLIHIQMHDQNSATGIKENYFNVPLAPGEGRSFNLSFDTLPNPPFKINYAMSNGELKNLGTYTP